MGSNPSVRSVEIIILAWVIGLFAITGIGMLPLFVYHVDLSKLTFSSRIPVTVGIGIELTAYAPTLAALAVAPIAGGFKRLLRPAIQWRAGVQWYALALLGPSALFLIGDVLRLLVRAPLPTSWLTIPSASALAFLVGALIAGSFGEELGWRGLGQPLLQLKYGALVAAVVVGAVWSLWHLWPAVAPGGAATTTWSDAVLTFVRLISTSILYAWLFNSTRGSLLIVMLAHAGHNLAARLVPLADSGAHGDPVVAGLYALAALVVLLTFGGRWLSRLRAFPDRTPVAQLRGSARTPPS